MTLIEDKSPLRGNTEMTALKKAAGARLYVSKNVYGGVKKVSPEKAKAYLERALKAIKKGAAKQLRSKA